MPERELALRTANDRVVMARATLATAKAELDAAKVDSEDRLGQRSAAADLAWTQAAQEYSSALVAYSDVLIRPILPPHPSL